MNKAVFVAVVASVLGGAQTTTPVRGPIPPIVVEDQDRKESMILQYQFVDAVKEFREEWNKLVDEWAQYGTWNVKRAKKVHKLFERLVKQQGWVEAK